MSLDAKLPPGPETPPAEQGFAWMSRPDEFMLACTERYGSTFTARLDEGPAYVFVSAPDAVRQVFTAPAGTFSPGEGHRLLRPIMGAQSLLLIDGERHADRRRVMFAPMRPNELNAYGEMMQAAALAHVESWTSGHPVAALEAMLSLSLEVICRAVLGGESADSTLRESIAAMMSLSVTSTDLGKDSALRLPAGSRLLAARQALDQALLAEIARRRASGDPRGMLGHLMTSQDDTGAPLGDEEICDQVCTLFVAGHETTATALAWALSHLARDEAMQEELAAQLAALGPEPAAAALAEHELLTAVCMEALRLHPPVPAIFWRLETAYEIAGWQLDPGIRVAVAILAAHRQPALYPEPERFDPQRFVGGHFSSYEYLPFGGGARRCIGMHFALYEMKVALGTLAARLKFLPTSAQPIRAVRRSVTLAPSSRTVLAAQRRAVR